MLVSPYDNIFFSRSTPTSTQRSRLTVLPLTIDHCLETIRLSVMCVPDLTPLELYWESQEGRKWEVAAKSDSQRECVKWDLLNEWMAPRHYNLNDLAQGSEFEIEETV